MSMMFTSVTVVDDDVVMSTCAVMETMLVIDLMCDVIDITSEYKSNRSEVALIVLQNVGCVNVERSDVKNVLRSSMRHSWSMMRSEILLT